MKRSPSRLHRVPPERSGPIRNPLVRENSRAPSPPGTLRDALEYGVQTAYSVIDEYMRRGYQAARHNQSNGNSKGYMNNERTNYGSFNPWGSMTPFMEQWMAAFRMWADAWSAFVPGMRPPFPSQPWMGAPPGFSAPTAPTAISLSVFSSRPAEVTVNLMPGAELMDLRADSFEPALRSTVSISQKPGGGVDVRLTVANDQATGVYHGVIRAGDGTIVGNLDVVITPLPTHPI